MAWKIFSLFFLIITFNLPAQNLSGSKPHWSQKSINGYLANLDIKIPKEMIVEIVDKNLTGISIKKIFDKFQGLMEKNGKKIYIPNKNETFFDGFGG